MSISTVPYEKITFGKLLGVIKWAQNKLSLRDWTIELEFGDELPKWADWNDDRMASIQSNTPYLSAKLWVSQSRCKSSNCNPISVVLHELLHTLLYHYNIQNHDERLVNILECYLFKSWLIDQQQKIKRKR